MKKTLIAVFILSFSLIGAYLIVSKPEEAPLIAQKNNSETSSNNPVGIETVNSNTSANNTINLSELIGKKIAEDLVNTNTNGFAAVNGVTYVAAPKPAEEVENLLLEAQKNFDPNSLKPTIKDFDLKISEDNSVSSLEKYFASFQYILVANAKKMPVGFNNPEKLSLIEAKTISEVYGQTMNDFYNLTVPRSTLNIHKTEIELLGRMKNIFQKIADSEKDPLSAILASNELLKIQTDSDKFILEMTDFKKSFSLN